MALRNAALVAAVALVALCACALAQAPCAATTTPAAPLKLHAKKVTATSVEFAWLAPKAAKAVCLDTYNFYILKKGGEAALMGKAPARNSMKCGGIVKQNTASFVAKDLTPNTEYTFAVNAANAKGASPDAKLVVKTKAA